MAITALTAKVTRTSAADDAAVAINTITGKWTVHLKVSNLSAASGTPDVRIHFNDSVDAHTAQLAGPTFSFQEAIGAEGKVVSFTQADFPSLRFGTTSAVIRTTLEEIRGTTPTVDYSSWIES